MHRLSVAILLLLGGIVLLATGCTSDGGRILTGVRVSSATVSASGGGLPTSVSYTLTRPATVSAYLIADTGDRLFLRKDEVRPVAGEYSLSFNGAYAPAPATDERRIAPSGNYRLVVEAKDGQAADQAEAQIQVVNADTTVPSVKNLTLFPEILSPNEDGIDDTTRITYKTDKLATVTIYVVDQSGKRFVLERDKDQPAGEHSTNWDGQINSQLLPSGDYIFVVEAEDKAGNVVLAEKPLKLETSSIPEAHILSVDFSPTSVLLGDLITVTIRVKNTGNTVLRTQGPDPGYVYDSQEGFSTIESGKYRDQKGLWRVGADWAGAPGASGSRYPYRWGFGKDLSPGEEVTVVGYIRMNHKYPRIWLHAGLVQEQVRYWDNEVGQTVIETGY